ncbi:malonate decarboxylase holo-ACP synthase [Rugamonas apoptosis]|uniref:Malonate decarboxylase holo-ACP synthase n=1 Tax=Rugamonas apoptosis TaxID=2758570 RepID=A0A7W2FDX3_9BURK|nr:malonate decarboxylase holo-ACP synthase [Rugamonas apoptosis]MBA5689862.1 malonate decarboxylase holo-ACP synthase [Rugamonas apoptosis]
MDFRPHDLLWLDRPDAFVPAGGRPACLDGEGPVWLDGAWLARAPLVVRREAVISDRVPVGARGLRRNQRCAGYAWAGALVRHVSPAMLAQRVADDGARFASAAVDLPCVAALLALASRLNALGLEWGPAGGVGFWLASELPVLSPTSDLDLLVRAHARLDPAVIAVLNTLQESAPCRLDIQIDTGVGGFALSEYAAGAGRVLLKTARGPLLLADPWTALEAA